MPSNLLERVRALADATVRRLARDAGRLLVGSVGASLLGLVSLVVTTQSLGVADFGALVLATTYVTIVATVFNFQPWQAFIKYGAEYLAVEDQASFQGLVRFTWGLDFATAVLGATAGMLLAGPVGELLGWSEPVTELARWYAITTLFNVIGAPTGILRMFDAYRALAIFAVFASALRLIGVALAALFMPTLVGFAIAWGVASIVADAGLVTFALWLLRDRGYRGWWRHRLADWRAPLRFAALNNLTSTLALPITQFDVVLTSHLVSLEATGVYKVMKQVASIFGKLSDPIYQVVYPEFARAIAHKEVVTAVTLCKKVGGLILAVLGPVTAVAVLTSDLWFGWVFGAEFASGAAALNVFLVLKLVSVVFVAIHPLFLALGHAGWNTIIQLVANLSYIAIAWVLGTHLGLLGIVLAYGASLVFIAGPKVVIVARRARAAAS